MSRVTLPVGWAAAVIITGALSGCMTYSAYTKCGFGGCPGDANITNEVRALFNKHAVLEPPNIIDVQTVDHIVYLNGLVDTDLERQLAESVAREAQGVTKVINSIGISSNR
jgi:osmotically-inducible protein OsmY